MTKQLQSKRIHIPPDGMIQRNAHELTLNGFGRQRWGRFIRDSKASEKKYGERNLKAYCSRTGTKGNETGYWLGD